MTGKELYEHMEQVFREIGIMELDPWNDLTETDQLHWERLAIRLREVYGDG